MAGAGREKTIESVDQFADDTAGQAERWDAEMVAAEKETEKWAKQGQRIIDRFLDLRGTASTERNKTRLNLFTSNIQTLEAMLYGQVPAVDCKRRYDDANDDAARVASNILERLLNNDIQREDDSYTDTLRQCLSDRLLPGLGCARVRYEAEMEEVEVPPLMQPGPDGEPVEMAEGYTESKKVWEDAIIDYVAWRDVRWSPARVWKEVRWLAFRSYLTKDQMTERFGKKIAKAVPYGSSAKGTRRTTRSDAMEFDAWQRCEVWEIWDKSEQKAVWWVKGYDETLDTKDDPLELTGFFPAPKFLLANPTTSSVMPRADFDLHRDLYNEIDYVSTRIERLERAVKAVGVYDKNAVGVQRMLQEGIDNDLIPVDNWAGFAEGGGIAGAVQWMPLQDIVMAMDKLREYRKELIDLLYQVSGMSDIMRGATTQPNVTATEQGLKARFASVRVTALQDQFADFASDLQRLKAEIIVKHFDDDTIIQRSNIMSSYDAPLVPQAMKLLREDIAAYKIEIMPDNITRADYASLKNDRTEFLGAIGTFIGEIMPMAQQVPESGPMLVEMVRWAAAGFRGGQQIEAVVDQFLDTLKQAGKQKQGGEQKEPSPEEIKAKSEQARAQARIQEQQMKGQQKLQEIAAKQQADMQKLMEEHQNEMAQIQADLSADLRREQAQTEFNAMEEEAGTDAAIREAAGKARYENRTP